MMPNAIKMQNFMHKSTPTPYDNLKNFKAMTKILSFK